MGVGDCWMANTPWPLCWLAGVWRGTLFRGLICCVGVFGALSKSSVFVETDLLRGGFAGGSGVTADSAGVDEAEAPGLFAFVPRTPPSVTSGLSADFITFALGRVPKGAMLATTPCLSMPASAKLGRGAGIG